MTLMKRCLATLAAIMLAVVGLGTATAVAGADVQDRRGLAGKVISPPQARCDYMRNTSSGWLAVSTYPPTVYAAQGKRQSVIYRLLLADANTGKLLQTSNWSGAQSVTGNRPARWNGVGTLTGAWQGNYHLEFEVRFFQPGGKWQGTITSLQTRYQIFNQRIGPYGPTSSCVKLKNFG